MLCSVSKAASASWLVALLLCASATGLTAGSNDPLALDLDRARKAFQQYYLDAPAGDAAEAARLAQALPPDGSWPDIDYQNRERAGWAPRIHLVRIATMEIAARRPSTPAPQQQALTQAVQRALAYWREHDFQCPNWWHNRIGVPQQLGEIALLLDDQLQPDDLAYITKTVMPRCAVGKSTGENRVWLAGCNLMDGLIRRDPQTVATAAPIIFAEAVVASGREGVQADFSFHQHGPQLQFGNYGLAFAADQVKWMTILQGTRWASSPAQLEVLRRYLLDGLNWVVWRGALDISSCGRRFQPDHPALRARNVAELMSRLARLDPNHAGEYQSFLKRNAPGGTNDLIGCRYFWRSDYLVQRAADFCFTLKMSSARVVGSESLNGENLSGYYLGDGATYIYRTGEEYQNIFPVWDWRKLPGVTCPQTQEPPPRFGSYRLKSQFVGAVTDGTNGCAALDYHRDGVSARKAWFVSDDQIVCVGSTLRAAANVTSPLSTTVNQCRLQGPVRIRDGDSDTTLPPGTHTFEHLRWVEHDGICYRFPFSQKISLSNQPQGGNWQKVARGSYVPQAPVSQDVFTLSIDHGLQPKDGSYAYAICPLTAHAAEPYEILANTDALQAVRFGSNLVAAVFYTPGRLDNACGHSVVAGSPCLLLLTLTQGALQATVADPTQSLPQLRLQIDGKDLDVRLPQGPEAGKSVRAYP